jgi:WD40 repeat protein
VAFSPDGTRIVIAEYNSARVWDATTGAEVAQLKGHTDSVNGAAFSPDGTRIVTTSSDGTSRIWDSKSGTELARFDGHRGNGVAFSPDGTRILTNSEVWDAKTGAKLISIGDGHSFDRGLAYSPDGTRIVTGMLDNTARIWDAKSGAELARLKGHTDRIRSAVFSPDGTRVLTASLDKTARIWDTKFGQALVDSAKDRVPRCLTQTERKEFYLPPAPPSWCIEMNKWPYNTQVWKDWLAAKRAPKNQEMPSD